MKNLSGLDWEKADINYATFYEKLDAKYNSIYKYAAKHLYKLASLSNPKVIVDVGCGIGISTETVAHAVTPECQIWAIDIGQAMIDRAKSRLHQFRNVNFRKWSAYETDNFARAHGLVKQVDLAYSSFTYSYLKENRYSLYRQIHNLLRPNGYWAFNIPTYFRLIEHDGQVYNSFVEIFFRELDRLLRDKGYKDGIGHRVGKTITLDDEKYNLRHAGFENVHSDILHLPLTPSQVLNFTIEGFYSFGLRPTFSSTLCELPVRKRIVIIREALTNIGAEMDNLKENPVIINLIAQKPL